MSFLGNTYIYLASPNAYKHMQQGIHSIKKGLGETISSTNGMNAIM